MADDRRVLADYVLSDPYGFILFVTETQPLQRSSTFVYAEGFWSYIAG